MSMTNYQSHGFSEPVSTLRVIEIDPQTDPRWEALVSSLPNGQIYHHPAWLKVLEEAFSYKPINLACEDAKGQLRGILPLFYMRGLFTGRRFASLPRTPVAGPLAYDDQATAVLVQTAVERVREERGAQLQLKVSSNALDGLVEGVVGTPWRESYVLELPERPELLRIGNSRNHARIKWSVNKATKSGVEILPAESEHELRAWYELYLETMRWLAVPPRPYNFFEISWKRLQPRGLMRLLLARHYEAGRSKVLAGSLFLMFGKTAFYAFTGWRRENQLLRANDALQLKAIQGACADGFRYYDFGEVTKNNQSLAEFKSKWGAEATWLYRYYYPAPRELETGILDSNSRAHQIASNVWRRLPIKATALLSDWAHHYF
jgi:hypothetical protein